MISPPPDPAQLAAELATYCEDPVAMPTPPTAPQPADPIPGYAPSVAHLLRAVVVQAAADDLRPRLPRHVAFHSGGPKLGRRITSGDRIDGWLCTCETTGDTGQDWTHHREVHADAAAAQFAEDPALLRQRLADAACAAHNIGARAAGYLLATFDGVLLDHAYDMFTERVLRVDAMAFDFDGYPRLVIDWRNLWQLAHRGNEPWWSTSAHGLARFAASLSGQPLAAIIVGDVFLSSFDDSTMRMVTESLTYPTVERDMSRKSPDLAGALDLAMIAHTIMRNDAHSAYWGTVGWAHARAFSRSEVWTLANVADDNTLLTVSPREGNDHA